MFQKHFGGFSCYVNKLSLEPYDRNMASHPNAPKGLCCPGERLHNL